MLTHFIVVNLHNVGLWAKGRIAVFSRLVILFKLKHHVCTKLIPVHQSIRRNVHLQQTKYHIKPTQQTKPDKILNPACVL